MLPLLGGCYIHSKYQIYADATPHSLTAQQWQGFVAEHQERGFTVHNPGSGRATTLSYGVAGNKKPIRIRLSADGRTIHFDSTTRSCPYSVFPIQGREHVLILTNMTFKCVNFAGDKDGGLQTDGYVYHLVTDKTDIYKSGFRMVLLAGTTDDRYLDAVQGLSEYFGVSMFRDQRLGHRVVRKARPNAFGEFMAALFDAEVRSDYDYHVKKDGNFDFRKPK